ncbi:MAG: cell division protein FtsQ/DivIB [Rickettsiaceae bacterium]
MLIYYQRIILLIKLLFLLLIILFFSTNVFDFAKQYAKNYFVQSTASYGFVLSEIIIEGHNNSDLNEIASTIKADTGDPIFDIDIKEVKKKLENNIWIDSAIVERKLPSTLYIALVERVPIAIWQFQKKLYLIDSDGNRITTYEGQHLEDIIHVIGQDANIYAKNLIEELHHYPNLSTKIKSAVRYGKRRWNLNFIDNFIVKMPEFNFHSAYHYLYSLDKQNKLFGQGYKMLDLRNPNKYYFEQH